MIINDCVIGMSITMNDKSNEKYGITAKQYGCEGVIIGINIKTNKITLYVTKHNEDCWLGHEFIINPEYIEKIPDERFAPGDVVTLKKAFRDWKKRDFEKAGAYLIVNSGMEEVLEKYNEFTVEKVLCGNVVMFKDTPYLWLARYFTKKAPKLALKTVEPNIKAAKFNIGDTVCISKNLKPEDRFENVFVSNSMCFYKGKKAIIEDVEFEKGQPLYKLDIDDEFWYWSEEMFKKEQPKSKFKVGDVVRYVSGNIDRVIIKKVDGGYLLDGCTDLVYNDSELVLISDKPKKTINIQRDKLTIKAKIDNKVGVARCNAKDDVFDEKFGILLATARALGFSGDFTSKLVDLYFDNPKTLNECTAEELLERLKELI